MFPNRRMIPPFLVLAAIASACLFAATARADQLTAPVTGSLNDGREFVGTLQIASFRSRLNALQARGLLIGTIVDSQDRVTHVVSQRINLPILDIRAESLGFARQGCDLLVMETGPLNLQLFDRIALIDPIEIEIEADPLIGTSGTRLCDISDGFRTGTARAIARELNEIIDRLDDLDDIRF